jgi:hypothetical protein
MLSNDTDTQWDRHTAQAGPQDFEDDLITGFNDRSRPVLYKYLVC